MFLLSTAGGTGCGGQSEKGGSAVEQKQWTNKNYDLPFSASNEAYCALGRGETWYIFFVWLACITLRCI